MWPGCSTFLCDVRRLAPVDSVVRGQAQARCEMIGLVRLCGLRGSLGVMTKRLSVGASAGLIWPAGSRHNKTFGVLRTGVGVIVRGTARGTGAAAAHNDVQ